VDACKSINNSNIESSIMEVGFNEDPCKSHTYTHDVYGERFWAAREITGEMEQVWRILSNTHKRMTKKTYLMSK